MTRPAGRQDLRAQVWKLIRHERTSDDLKSTALGMLAAIEHADLGDAEAEARVQRALDHYVIDDDGVLTLAEPEPATSKEAAP